FPNGLLAVCASSQATLFETDTFTQWLPYRTYVGADGRVAGGLRHMYFLSRAGHLTALDSNGATLGGADLGATTAATPVVSANHVHVVTDKELRTLTWDLKDVASLNLWDLSAYRGLSSPAIGPDGSVYFAIGVQLHAYVGGRTLLPV